MNKSILIGLFSVGLTAAAFATTSTKDSDSVDSAQQVKDTQVSSISDSVALDQQRPGRRMGPAAKASLVQITRNAPELSGSTSGETVQNL